MRRIIPLALSFALLLSVTALGAGGLTVEQRQEDLDYLYSTLRDNHPNLFANTPESVFLSKKAEIESRLSETDDVTFLLDLMSLTALAGDSHTMLSFDTSLCHIYPVGLSRFGEEWVAAVLPEAYSAYLGTRVAAVNGLTMTEVTEKLAPLLASDNAVRLRRQVEQAFGIAELFAYAGITEEGGPLLLTLAGEDGASHEISLTALPAADRSAWPELSQLTPNASAPTAAQNRYYFSLPVGDAYYIQYNTCMEDPELPMEEFVEQVAADLAAGDYGKVLIDLRNNGGGSDGVLVPLLLYLAPMVRTGAIELWGLIGEATFSSAVINAMEIREMGGFLAGEPSGGSVDHFGAVNTFTLPHSDLRGQYSTRYISLADYLSCAVGLGVTPIQPDLTVSQTLTDYLSGRDTAVEAVAAMEEPFTPAAAPGRPLSRGEFTALLRQSVGAEADTGVIETPFGDLFPFNAYVPDVAWAAELGVVNGVAEGVFDPARTITLAEAAVMVERYLSAAGVTLPVLREDAAPPAAPWAAEAVEAAWSQGLLPEGMAAQTPLCRADGEQLLERLAEALIANP